MKIKGFNEDILTLGYCVNRTQTEFHNELIFERFDKQMKNNNSQSFEEYCKNYIKYSNIENQDIHKDLDTFVRFLNANGIKITKESLFPKLSYVRVALFEEDLLKDNEVNILTIEDIDSMSGIEFEDAIAKIFKMMGYSVEFTPTTRDQGADIIAKGFGEIVVIQTKNYSGNIGNGAIQEVTAAIPYYKATRGMVITNSYFTTAAIELAKSNNIELWNKEALIKQLVAYPITK